MHALAQPTVDGKERLDAVSAPVIFAANHHSHADTGLLLSLLPERFRRKTVVAAAADYFFDRRAKGTFHALTFGAVPMERTKVNRRSAEVATDLLADGWNLVIFPEGGRSPDGWAQEFRGGAAYLAVRSGRPVVPVYIEGTRHMWPKGQRLPRPYKVTVTFGTPISPDPGEDARRLAARLERAVAALADEQATDWWTARRRAAEGATPAITGPGRGGLAPLLGAALPALNRTNLRFPLFGREYGTECHSHSLWLVRPVSARGGGRVRRRHRLSVSS